MTLIQNHDGTGNNIGGFGPMAPPEALTLLDLPDAPGTDCLDNPVPHESEVAHMEDIPKGIHNIHRTLRRHLWETHPQHETTHELTLKQEPNANGDPFDIFIKPSQVSHIVGNFISPLDGSPSCHLYLKTGDHYEIAKSAFDLSCSLNSDDDDPA